MLLWSLHPKYLDPQGLVALWREALLAQAVLQGETRGYRHHPQLERFQSQPDPLSAISSYLRAVLVEARVRGYSFNELKVQPGRKVPLICVTSGQLTHEWQHLMQKLSLRNPAAHNKWLSIILPEPHPLFSVFPGNVEPWERLHAF